MDEPSVARSSLLPILGARRRRISSVDDTLNSETMSQHTMLASRSHALKQAVAGRWLLLLLLTILAIDYGLVSWHPDPIYSFQDTRTVTHSIDCVNQGMDPYVQSCDPWHRLYNYPPIWLGLRFLGIGSHSSRALGAIFGALSVSSLLLLFRTRSWQNSLLAALAFFSFPVFLAVREGNIDQVIFFALVFGLLLVNDSLPGKAALVVTMTVLKVFPVAAAILFLKQRRGVRTFLVVSLTSVAALAMTSGRTLPVYLHNTPHETMMSFGSYTTTMLLWQAFAHDPASLSQEAIARLATLLFCGIGILAFAFGSMARRRVQPRLPALDQTEWRQAAALAGMACFCLVFAISSSFEYRLMFLLPLIALLLDDTKQPRRIHPVLYLLIAGVLLPYATYHTYNTKIAVPLVIALLHSAIFLLCVTWIASQVAPGSVSNSSAISAR